MKKIIAILLLSSSLTLIAQISSIVGIDSVEYKVGDKIKMGKAMEGLPEYTYVLQWVKEDVSTLQKSTTASYDSIEIVSISLNSKYNDYNVVCHRKIPSTTTYITYSIVFNKAIESGEVISRNKNYYVVPTSNQALEQLKNAKEKLALGLITQDEYNQKLIELKKFIKE